MWASNFILKNPFQAEFWKIARPAWEKEKQYRVSYWFCQKFFDAQALAYVESHMAKEDSSEAPFKYIIQSVQWIAHAYLSVWFSCNLKHILACCDCHALN